MPIWTKDEDGSAVAHDEATGRTFSISDTGDGYLIRGVSRGGRARGAINHVPGKSQAVLEVMDHLVAGKSVVDPETKPT